MSQGPAWPLNCPNITSLLCLAQVDPSRPVSQPVSWLPQGPPPGCLIPPDHGTCCTRACGTVTSCANLGLFQRAWLAIWASLTTALITLSCTRQLHVDPSPLDREFLWGKGRVLFVSIAPVSGRESRCWGEGSTLGCLLLLKRT